MPLDSGQSLSSLASQIQSKSADISAQASQQYGQLQKQLESAPAQEEAQIRKEYPEGPPPPPKPVNIKPFQPPQQRSFLESFGGMATILGALGGLLTRHPLTASLNAASAAMQAYKKGDEEAYKNAYQSYKDNIDFAFKQSDHELAAYRTYLDDKNLVTDQVLNGIKTQAAIVGNQQMARMVEVQGLEGAADLYSKMQDANIRLKGLDLQVREFADQHQETMMKIGVQKDYQKALQDQRTAIASGDPKKIKDANAGVDEALDKVKALFAPASLAKPLTIPQMKATSVELHAQAQNYPPGSPERAQLEGQANTLDQALATQEAASSGVVLDDQTATLLAQAWHSGDTNPLKSVLGFSKNRPQLVGQVMKKMKELYPDMTGQQLAAYEAQFHGMLASTAVLGRTVGSVAIGAQELSQFAPLIEDVAKKIDRTQFPTINAVELAVQRGEGDPNVVALNSYIQSARNAYTQIMARGGRLTDTQRTYAKELIDGSLAPAQLSAALKALTTEAGVVKGAAGAAMKDITGQSSGPSLDEWLPQAKRANPNASDAELRDYWRKKYGGQ